MTADREARSASGPDPQDALERMLARLEAQRAWLDFAAERIAAVPGPVFELGLGKGRTYDRMRRVMADREIFAFDRELHCSPRLSPLPEHLFLGDFRDTLLAAAERFGRSVALVHADIGSEVPARDAAICRDIGPLIERVVRRQGLVLCDRPLPLSRPGWEPLPPPAAAATAEWPYFGWCRSR